MEDLFVKLDLGEYYKTFKSYLAREKPIFLQGDNKLNYIIINELSILQYKNPPEVSNLQKPLVHLSKQGILSLFEIYEFVKIINYMKYLQNHFFEGSFGAWLSKIRFVDEILEISNYFNDKGELKEEIDERFIQINATLKQIKAQSQAKMKEILYTKRLEPYFADKQIHYINNQEALLLRGGFNHVLKGTVIARSTSGFFYVAPSSLDTLRQRESEQLDKKEEIIYEYTKKISGIFAKNLGFLKFIDFSFDKFDALNARVMMAKSFDYEFVLAEKTNRICLKDFFHPAIKDAKPLSLDFKAKLLMITGVNAGGKTMFLKSLLSAVLLSKYLLPMKIDATNSVIGIFKGIEAIIEDPQNIKNDISTFAGRILAFSKLFHKSNLLIGIDEIELGTDADEASSLYKVMLERLMQKDLKIIITTHHKKLAALLAKNDEVELLAALYDEKAQKPKFEFLKGTIGKSYAFETAIRYGIPENLVTQAKTLYGENREKLDDLIQKNIDLELVLKEKISNLDKKEKKLESMQNRLKDQIEQNEDNFQKMSLKLEKEYTEAILAAKKAAKSQNLKETHQGLNLAHNIKNKIRKINKNDKSDEIHIGDSVKYLNQKGIVISLRKNKALIDCDGINLYIDLKDLRKIANLPKIKEKKTTIKIEKINSGSVKLDLHGLRAEEALELLDKFLSDALISGFDEVLVYHGIGTGKLAYAVKNFLSTHPKVQAFNDALASQGGYGATVVKL